MADDPKARPPRLRRNALANLVGRVGSVAIGIAITPYALERLGPERFGIWSLFFVISGSIAALDLGMWAGVSRFVAMAAARGERRGVRRTVRRGLAVALGLGLVWGALCALGAGTFVSLFHVPAALEAEVRRALPIFAVSLVLLSGQLVFQGALTGLQRLDLWNGWFTVGLLVNAGVLIHGLSRGLGLVAAAQAMVAGSLVTALGASWSTRANVARVGNAREGDGPTLGEMVRYGLVVQAANALGLGQMQAGKVLLGLLGRLAAVGQFELGMRVANALWSIPVLIQMSVVPAAAHASATGGAAAVREVYDWCCRWVFAAGAWALGALWLVAPPLFFVWLGPGHEQAVATARWLAAAFLVGTLAGPGTAIGRGHGWPDLEALNFGIALVVNVLAAFLVVPRLGAPGAAIAMTVAFAVSTAAMVSILHRRLEVASGPWLRRLVLPRYLAAAGIAAALAPVLARATFDSRGDAVVAVLASGAAFSALYVAATWRTGDPAALWLFARERFARLHGAPQGVV